MQTERVDGEITNEGTYVARRRDLARADLPGWQVVQVQREHGGSADPLVVWQLADNRRWPVAGWEFLERIWPGS